LQLLAAALTVLLRRTLHHAAMRLHAGAHHATALRAALARFGVIMRPLITRSRGTAMRCLSAWRARVWRSAVRRSALAGAAAPGGSPAPAAAGGPAAPSLPPPSLPSGSSAGAAPPQRRRFRLLRAIFWTASATLLSLAIFLGYCLYTLPLAPHNPAAAAPAALVLEADNGQPFATRGVYKGQWVPANQLPGDFVHAVVAIKDRRFFQHSGIDFWGIARAAVADLLSDSVPQGDRTITQQLVRMNYLSPQRTIVRKVQEALLSLWLEHRLAKFEILARYVNTAYYGAGAYGIDAAAERYFGKHAPALDLAESAMLAGLINAPSERAPTTNLPTVNLKGARERAAAVLHAMVEEGYITPAQAAAARAHPARLIVPPAAQPGRNYFADTAQAEVRNLIGVPLSNLTVKTTLDPALQALAERVVDRWLARDGKKRHIGQAALVALAPDGAVLAMVGGRNYDKSQFNRATQALRQPGSLFKIFVYLAALDAGYTPDSIVVDQPVQIGDRRPKDYERRSRGPVTLKTAFADSINTVSAQLVQKIGVQKVIAMARRLGITTPLPAGGPQPPRPPPV
jgi:penicillin-binding protein 1A